LEAMSQNVGAMAPGFVNNFVYGALVLGNNTRVQLVDQSHNSAAPGVEAVYASVVQVPTGCTLDLNGLQLYARGVLVSGTVLNGTITQVPDAGALTMATPTPGSISTAGELDEWTFFARGGSVLTAQVNPGTGGSPAALPPPLQWVRAQLLAANNTV